MPGRPVNEFSAHAFWDWSCDVYDGPGMQETLLDLQDRMGLDVNLLLFACWTASKGYGYLSEAQWTRLIEETAGWRVNVIGPLRAVRRYLKESKDSGGANALRDKLKMLELEAEHAAQLAIADLVRNRSGIAVPMAAQIADARANLLSYYLAAAGGEPSGDDMALLTSIARACCGPQQVQG